MTAPVALPTLDERYTALTTGDYGEAVELLGDALSEIETLRQRLSDCVSWRAVPAPQMARALRINQWETGTIYAYAQTRYGDMGQCYELVLPPLPEAPK